MQFSAIPDHPQEKQHLLYLVKNNRIPHAQLYWGPPGAPSLAMALAFATLLHCSNQGEDACGHCVACQKMQRLTHPDIRFTFPIQSASNELSDTNSNHFVKPWHRFLQQQPYGDMVAWSEQLGLEGKNLLIPRAETMAIHRYLQTPPLVGKYKISLIWLPEYLHSITAHALLKLLEEPPLYTLFLLVSMAPEKLLSTLRSRLQSMYIAPFTDQALVEMLALRYNLPRSKIEEAALLANGNPQKAHDFLTGEQDTLFEEFSAWFRLCYACDLPRLLARIERWQAMSKEKQKRFFCYTLHIMRLTLLEQFGAPLVAGLCHEEREFAKKLGALLDYSAIRQVVGWLGQVPYYLERNMNTKVLFLHLSLQLVQLFESVRSKQVPAR
jgi:DNA polymerase-3 subunit delta'